MNSDRPVFSCRSGTHGTQTIQRQFWIPFRATTAFQEMLRKCALPPRTRIVLIWEIYGEIVRAHEHGWPKTTAAN